jgi:hypothetical protein
MRLLAAQENLFGSRSSTLKWPLEICSALTPCPDMSNLGSMGLSQPDLRGKWRLVEAFGAWILACHAPIVPASARPQTFLCTEHQFRTVSLQSFVLILPLPPLAYTVFERHLDIHLQSLVVFVVIFALRLSAPNPSFPLRRLHDGGVITARGQRLHAWERFGYWKSKC